MKSLVISSHRAMRKGVPFKTHKRNRVAKQTSGVPEKKVTDLIMGSTKNLALINRKQYLNYSLIVNLKIDSVFVDIVAFTVEVFIIKV